MNAGALRVAAALAIAAALPALAPAVLLPALAPPALIVARGSPQLDVVLPRGGQRGTELHVTFHGARLLDATDVLFHEPGIEFLSIETPDEGHAIAKLRIAPDCPLGEHRLRLRTRTGLTELRTFWVGPFPVVDEVEPNSDLKALADAQPIVRNVTVQGVVTNEDVDLFAIEMKAGERLTAEVEGIRLGETLFDPFVAILDEKRFELASCDDSALFRQDPVASCLVPADGRYFVLVRESSFGGNDRCRYRLHVGTFPRPLVASPAGGRPGSDVTLTLLGDVRGDLVVPVHLPDSSSTEFTVWPEQDGVPAPSGLPLRVNASPAFDGVLSSPGEVDEVRFAAKKDERLHMRVNCRSIRSPADPVLSIHKLDGTQLDAADDVIGLDSYLQFTPPEDGDYLARIRDHLGAGGPTYVWRLVMAPVGSALSCDVPRFGRDSQARQSISVPRGGRCATALHVGRGGFAGPVAISAADLPAGVTMHAVELAPSLDTLVLVFEAAADAPLAGALVDVAVDSVPPKPPADAGAAAAGAPPPAAAPIIKGRLRQRIELVVAPPNDTNFYDVSVDRLAVAVTEEAPFTLDVVPPKAPLVQNGVVDLRVVAKRREGFDAPIVVRMLWVPPGVGAQPTITIPQGQSEAAYTLNANGDAPPGTWQLALLGEGESGRGVVLASSALTPVTIAPPFVAVKLDLAAVEQGQKTQVVAHVEPVTPFDGKAKISLRGLPPKASCEDHEFAAGDTTVVFDVATAPDTPAGKHTTLFVQVIVQKEGEPVVHYLGGGGTLRVDPPPPPSVTAAAAPPPPEPAAAPVATEAPPAPPKPLSRLEKLRLEAKQRREAAPAPPQAAPTDGGKPAGGTPR